MTNTTSIQKNNFSQAQSPSTRPSLKGKLLPVLLSLFMSSSFMSTSSTAAEPSGEILLDGISTVISFNSSDDASAILILSSDVELMARILLVNQYGKSWKKHAVDNAVGFKARRLATIVKLLAHVATLVGEKVDTSKRDTMLSQFIQRAGGQKEIRLLLNQCGAKPSDLQFWFSNLLMCKIQLQYLADQVQLPTDDEIKKMFKKGGHSLVGAEWKQAQTAYKKILRNEELQKILSQWLDQFEQQGKIDFVQ